MRLIIQIPCLNEEESLARTLDSIPKNYPQISQVTLLVIDDGSTDKTVEIAKSYPVDHLLCLGKHCGLGVAFATGLKTGLELGGDFFVNLDADNQYYAEDIEKLLLPLLRGEVDKVIGERCHQRLRGLPRIRQWLHKLGTWTMQKASRTLVTDPTSGFRAFSRRGAQSMNISSRYTYTLESIIHSGRSGLKMAFVPIRSRPVARKSRLIKSLPQFILKQAFIVVKTTVPYLLKGLFLKGALSKNPIPSGNFFDKHKSRKLGARLAMHGFRSALLELARMTQAKRVHELGCGEGHLTHFLYQHGFSVSGSDVCESILHTARKNHSGLEIHFCKKDIFNLDPSGDSAPLIVCCEVLEHLENPTAGLTAISKVAAPWAIFSVPREPLWRILNFLSLRYIRSLGNTPGHLQHWSSGDFLRMIEKHFDVVAVRKPLPWTLVLAKRKLNSTNGNLHSN